MKKSGSVGPIVGSTFFSSDGHRLGLYVAWHLGQPWYGDVPFGQIDAYRDSGVKYTIAIPKSPLGDKLESDPVFKNVSSAFGEGSFLQVFEILPGKP